MLVVYVHTCRLGDKHSVSKDCFPSSWSVRFEALFHTAPQFPGKSGLGCGVCDSFRPSSFAMYRFFLRLFRRLSYTTTRAHAPLSLRLTHTRQSPCPRLALVARGRAGTARGGSGVVCMVGCSMQLPGPGLVLEPKVTLALTLILKSSRAPHVMNPLLACHNRTITWWISASAAGAMGVEVANPWEAGAAGNRSRAT